MARTTTEVMREIRRARMSNRLLYAGLEDDKTMDLVERMYQQNPELAKRWHREVLPNDLRNAELTAELCGWTLKWELVKEPCE